MDRGNRQLHYLLDRGSYVSIASVRIVLLLSLTTDFVHSGAWIVDPLNHYLGRRGEIFVTALCLTATPIGSGFAQSWQGLFAARFVMGIGIGAKNATVPIYSAEMAPARTRGALVMFWQLWVVAGEYLSSLVSKHG
jgi:Sugar (and other) transporter.